MFDGKPRSITESIRTANYLKSWVILYRWERGIKDEKRWGWRLIDLLCSRNARSQKTLVGRAQWKINQPPSLKREQASVEGGRGRLHRFFAPGTRALRRASFDGRSRTDSRHPPKEMWKGNLRKMFDDLLGEFPVRPIRQTSQTRETRETLQLGLSRQS